MNTRSLTVVLASIAMSSLGACTLISTTGGAGGSTGGISTGDGGASSTVTTGTSGGTGGATTTTSTTTSTGTGMCNPTYTCVEAIAQGSGDPAELCEGPALKEFNALADCTCKGNCAKTCADNVCKQQDPSAECKACLSTAGTGCKTEFDNCINGT